MKKIVLIFILGLLSCNKSKQDNIKLLFKTEEKAIPSLKIDDFKQGVYDLLEKKLNYNICNSTEKFELLISEYERLEANVNKNCPNKESFSISCFRFPFRYFINKNGNIIYEGGYPKDINIIEKAIVYYENEDPDFFKNSGVELEYSLLCPKDSLIKSIINIKKGYLKVYHKYSERIFNKTINELNENELFELKKQLKFKLRIKELQPDNFMIPPPPPPLPKTID